MSSGSEDDKAETKEDSDEDNAEMNKGNTEDEKKV